MAFLALSRKIALLLGAATLCILVPQTVLAGTIGIYGIPTHYRHQDYPCIFSGNDGCHDPAAWPAPAESTTNDWGGVATLTRDYSGADFTAFNTVVGSTFVLGLDFNSNATHAALQTLTIDFYGAAGLLDSWVFPAPTGGLVTPDLHNGDGYPDYVFAAGCAGTTAAILGYSPFVSCSSYTPFVAPVGTNRITFAFGYNNPDDGDEDLYVIAGAEQPLPEVPEPATLLLLSTGLFVTAWRLRRRA